MYLKLVFNNNNNNNHDNNNNNNNATSVSSRQDLVLLQEIHSLVPRATDSHQQLVTVMVCWSLMNILLSLLQMLETVRKRFIIIN